MNPAKLPSVTPDCGTSRPVPEWSAVRPASAGVQAKEGKVMAGMPEVRPLADALGSEVLGVDLSRLDHATFDGISNALAEHPVLVFRDQKLEAGDIAAFGQRFGVPRKHALVKYRHAEYPEVSWLTNVEEDGAIDWYGVKRATDWHTDSTYEPELPLLAMLHALEVPSRKGGTMFANIQATYDTRPETMKERLAGLVGLHGRSSGPAGERLYGDEKGATEKEYTEQPRPAVIAHPVTGRPILFVNPMHTHGFIGIDRDAAWELIEELAAHATQERFTYYHSWQFAALLIGANCATIPGCAGYSYPG